MKYIIHTRYSVSVFKFLNSSEAIICFNRLDVIFFSNRAFVIVFFLQSALSKLEKIASFDIQILYKLLCKFKFVRNRNDDTNYSKIVNLTKSKNFVQETRSGRRNKYA